MSKLDRFMAKPIIIELDGIELDIHPLEMKDLPLIMKISSKNEDRQAEGFVITSYSIHYTKLYENVH